MKTKYIENFIKNYLKKNFNRLYSMDKSRTRDYNKTNKSCFLTALNSFLLIIDNNY